METWWKKLPYHAQTITTSWQLLCRINHTHDNETNDKNNTTKCQAWHKKLHKCIVSSCPTDTQVHMTQIHTHTLRRSLPSPLNDRTCFCTIIFSVKMTISQSQNNAGFLFVCCCFLFHNSRKYRIYSYNNSHNGSKVSHCQTAGNLSLKQYASSFSYAENDTTFLTIQITPLLTVRMQAAVLTEGQNASSSFASWNARDINLCE